MATNFAISNALFEEARITGGHKTPKGVITEALQEYIQGRKQQEITKLFGKIDYDPDYDHKTQRKIP